MSNILSYLGWTFLPNFVTNNLQTFYYSLTIRAGSPKPQPGTPLHTTHRRRIHIAVIVVYLLYSLYEADWDVRRAGDFYADLGVPHNVEEKALGSRFRRLTLLYHPDKLTDATADRAAAEAHYVHLKLARDTLMDPAKRFAYDRFGPGIVGWRECATIGEFVMTGMKAIVPFYAGSVVVLGGMGLLGFFEWGRYWRYLSFTALALFELSTITRPTFPYLPTHLPTYLSPFSPLPPYLPFQALLVAHKAIITFFIALNQLGPLLQAEAEAAATAAGGPGPGAAAVAGGEKDNIPKYVQRLEQLVAVNGVEAARLLGLEGAPFVVGDGRGGITVDGEGVTWAAGPEAAGSEVAGSGGAGAASGAVDAPAKSNPPVSGNSSGTTITTTTTGRSRATLRNKIKEWFVTNAVRNDVEVRGVVAEVVRRRGGVLQGVGRGGGNGGGGDDGS